MRRIRRWWRDQHFRWPRLPIGVRVRRGVRMWLWDVASLLGDLGLMGLIFVVVFGVVVMCVVVLIIGVRLVS